MNTELRIYPFCFCRNSVDLGVKEIRIPEPRCRTSFVVRPMYVDVILWLMSMRFLSLLLLQGPRTSDANFNGRSLRDIAIPCVLSRTGIHGVNYVLYASVTQMIDVRVFGYEASVAPAVTASERKTAPSKVLSLYYRM
jgi:hypothetical protein